MIQVQVGRQLAVAEPLPAVLGVVSVPVHVGPRLDSLPPGRFNGHTDVQVDVALMHQDLFFAGPGWLQPIAGSYAESTRESLARLVGLFAFFAILRWSLSKWVDFPLQYGKSPVAEVVGRG